MTINQLITIPQPFEKYRALIEQTIQPVVTIQTTVKQTSLFESKFAGDPYFPLTMEYPKNAVGQPLKLLAQINFADIPKHLPHFPVEGILQFFIDGYDDVLGLDFDNAQNQDGFCIIYHEQIEKDTTQLMHDFAFVTATDDELYFPVEKEMALSFESKFEPLSIEDFRNSETYKEIWKDVDHNPDLENQFFTSFSGTGHKLGGFAFFTQEDPRSYVENLQSHKILLLQVDSEMSDIIWGDCGVGNFFITEEQLKQKDFSKVLYNWDCS
ncbi:hypothetical protein CSE16_17265 [Solibacillus sp. R5-41]|uniref:YwqG family protein n=1 Tax=Solibacillus sp. R5-41 TaxID=2048654 RepID=UPI000C124E5B|nr:DUF1963 domain-containing protein [Solibacillus sp. R5-41]ATP41643.1 hypothetical protein CSE16_17265 [Solibacillus sp. R5-41]